jgi:D-3-phosphoglycerate dehydrogenase
MSILLFTTSYFDLNNFAERAKVESEGFEIMINPYGKRLSESQVAELLDNDVVGMVAGLEPLTGSVIRRAKALKVISRCGIGLDNVDLNAALEMGISVYNTPDAPTRAVAELTIGHILSLSRRIAESDRLLRGGQWQSLMGSLLAKQVIGIIGFGRIGKMVASLLQIFDAKILVHDPYQVISERNVEAVPLKQLLADSDIVTLHLPYGQESHYIMNAETLSLMKPNALLINVSRGGLVDEEALFSVLQAEKLGGAALDCFESEPYSGPLLNCNRVQMTAHMGSYAKEARAMMEAESCAALMDGLRKQGLIK